MEHDKEKMGGQHTPTSLQALLINNTTSSIKTSTASIVINVNAQASATAT